MSAKRKIKILLILIFLALIVGGSIYGGWRLHEKYGEPKVEIKTISAIQLVEYDDLKVFEEAVKQASEKYGIKEEVFYAIKECEGGSVWSWNATNDGGLYQINWKTAKNYGVTSLKDIIEPFRATELAAQILTKEGLEPWKATKKCILEKLIKINKKAGNN